MCPEPRFDEEHFDGGASILMAALTLYGSRRLHLQLDGAWSDQVVHQQAGSFYVGTMASVFHRVEHGEISGTLYQNASNEDGRKIVILFRSDCFAGNRGRVMASKPGPSQVFDIVNSVIAAKLARAPLLCPTAAEAMEAWMKSCERGLFQHEGALGAVSSKRRLLRAKTCAH